MMLVFSLLKLWIVLPCQLSFLLALGIEFFFGPPEYFS